MGKHLAKCRHCGVVSLIQVQARLWPARWKHVGCCWRAHCRAKDAA